MVETQGEQRGVGEYFHFQESICLFYNNIGKMLEETLSMRNARSRDRAKANAIRGIRECLLKFPN